MSTKESKSKGSPKDGSEPKAGSSLKERDDGAKVIETPEQAPNGQTDNPTQSTEKGTDCLTGEADVSGEQLMVLVPIRRTISVQLNEECDDIMMLNKATGSLKFTCELSAEEANKMKDGGWAEKRNEDEEESTGEVRDPRILLK